MKYQHLDTPAHIKAYKNNIRFASLYLGSRLMGTLGFCYRKISTAGKTIHGSYLRYYSFIPMVQAILGAKSKFEKRRQRPVHDSLKSKILALFGKPHLLDFPGHKEKDKLVIFAYAESRNEQLKNMINQIGFEHIRSFLTVAFSRYNPKEKPGVSLLQPNDRDEMKKLLAEFYSEYSFYNDEFAFCYDKCYVIKEGDEIIAGLSVIPNSIRLIEMPGIWGWIIMKILPRAPFYRRLFQPEEFRFLIFESIYYKKGKEKALEKLMESVCAIEGYNRGLAWLDDRSELYDMLRSEINMGIINRMLNARPGLIYSRFINMNEDEKEDFFERPAYISSFDFS